MLIASFPFNIIHGKAVFCIQKSPMYFYTEALQIFIARALTEVLGLTQTGTIAEFLIPAKTPEYFVFILELSAP